MEKTIEIDGKKVKLKSTGATPLRYKAQFGKDYFSELMKMGALQEFSKAAGEGEDILKNIDPDTFDLIDFEVFYQIIWVMAKTADKSIPEPLEWLDGFDEFPIMDILTEIQDLLVSTLKSKKK